MVKYQKIYCLLVLLFLFVSCRKGEDIATNLNVVTPPPGVTATTLSLSFSGTVNLNDTLLQHIAEFSAIETYSDGSTQTFVPTADLISGWDTSSIGSKAITITKDSLTGTTNINVIPLGVTATALSLSFSGTVNLNDTLLQHIAEFSVIETYSNGSSSTFTPTADMLSGWDTSTIGIKPITITKDGLTSTTNINVVIPPVTPVSISIASIDGGFNPVHIRDTFLQHIDEFRLVEFYSDGSSETFIPTVDMFTGWNTSSGGDKTLVAHKDGLTDSMNVNVLMPISMDLTTFMGFTVGDLLDDYDFEITETFEDGYTQTFGATTDMISGYDSSQGNDIPITITGSVDGVSDTLIISFSNGG